MEKTGGAGGTEGGCPCPAAGAEDSPKRRQILDGARRMFLSKGFEGTSMQDVARTAGVSKGTLYVYFDSKEAMFKALVGAECGRMQQAVLEIGAGSGDVGEELRRIGLRMTEILLRQEVTAAMRMMIGSAERFPDLARAVYEAGPMGMRRAMSGYLTRRCTSGDLSIDDCEQAAAEFIELMIGGLQRRTFLMAPHPDPARIEAIVARRVDNFLRIYGAERG